MHCTLKSLSGCLFWLVCLPIVGSVGCGAKEVRVEDRIVGSWQGRYQIDQDEADALSAAAADYSEFAARQARRGWAGASAYVSFHSDVEFLLPDFSFVPFWVDGSGYWLVLAGEPLLNNPALVELLWGIKEAGNRFAAAAGGL